MAFIDEAKIFVAAGDGGDGVAGFRREKYVAAGGPDGGDGGDGGDVYFVANSDLTTLVDFKYRTHYRADGGRNGQGKKRHGKSGEPLIIQVPRGTVIWDEHKKTILADLVRPGQRWTAAQGGRGGRGNTRFKTSTRQAPGFFEKGEKGEERWVYLELKLLADVALVGFPNAGKSTFIRSVSKARPKVANYPFTTLVPNLGVVSLDVGESFVIADVPGLIEGAHEGVGLGHEFLRHIERSRILLYVIDASGVEGRNPRDDLRTLQRELRLYRSDLARRPSFIFANKADLSESSRYITALRAAAEEQHIPFYYGSAATGEGLRQVVYELWNVLQSLPPVFEDDEDDGELITGESGDTPTRRRRLNLKDFRIVKQPDGYVVDGPDLERLMARLDLESEAGMRYFQHLLSEIGVYAALRQSGVQEGEVVKVGDVQFEYVE